MLMSPQTDTMKAGLCCAGTGVYDGFYIKCALKVSYCLAYTTIFVSAIGVLSVWVWGSLDVLVGHVREHLGTDVKGG